MNLSKLANSFSTAVRNLFLAAAGLFRDFFIVVVLVCWLLRGLFKPNRQTTLATFTGESKISFAPAEIMDEPRGNGKRISGNGGEWFVKKVNNRRPAFFFCSFSLALFSDLDFVLTQVVVCP